MTPSVLAIFATIITLVPFGHGMPAPGFEETERAYRWRLYSIAETVHAVATSEREAALLVGLAHHESGFARDVDEGTCYLAWKGRCDSRGGSARAHSLWQIWVREDDHRRSALFRTDRSAAAREALRVAQASERVCARNVPSERLAIYAGGAGCDGIIVRAIARELDRYVTRAEGLLRAPLAQEP